MEKEQKSTIQPVKDEKKVSQVVEKPVIDEATQAAIQSAVQAAIGAIVPDLLKALTPLPVNSSVPVVQPGSITTVMNPNPPPAQVAYKTKLKGIPVHPGQDLRHVHPQEIKNWFARLENRWKENYAKKQAAALGSSVSLTMEAGTPFPFTPH